MRVANSRSVPLAWSTTGAAGSYTTSPGALTNATLYSEPVELRHLDEYALQLAISGGGTPTGTFILQASNSDPLIPVTGVQSVDASAMTWTDVDGSSIAITTDGNKMWNASGVGYLWVRIKWTKTSGTGNAVATFNGKGPS